METFSAYWLRVHKEKLPNEIPGTWFSQRDLPIIVQCRCCDMTMALPCALIDDDGYVYCSSCAEA